MIDCFAASHLFGTPQIAKNVEWHRLLVSAGIIPPLVAMIKHSHRAFQTVHAPAVEILYELSSLESAKPIIVQAGAIGFLMNISKGDNAKLRELAKTILYNLERDTAATVIQKVAKSFIVKRRFKVIKTKISGSLVMPDMGDLKQQMNFPKIDLKRR
jgi:hypothetical protein